MGVNHDGKVTICTALDNSDIEKDMGKVAGEFGGLDKVLGKTKKAITGALSKPVNEACAKIRKELSAAERQISQFQKQIQKSETAKMPLLEQANQLGAELDAAKAKLAELQAQQRSAEDILSSAGERELSGPDLEAYLNAYSQKPQIDADVSQQQAQVDAIQKKWDDTNSKIEAYNAKIAEANQEIARQKINVAELGKKYDIAEKETKQIRENITVTNSGVGTMGRSVRSFTSRLKSIALGALFFNGISAGLREFTTYMGNALKKNEAFTVELARMKGALLTAFQPIYNAVAPAVTSLVRLLTIAATALANFFAALTGTTVDANAKAAESLYEEAKAIGAVGSAAKKAKKSVAGFDELNVIQDKDTASGGSGGVSSAVKPDFSVSAWTSEQLETVKEKFKDIAGYIAVAAAGIAGFKLGTFIADLLTSNKKAKSLKDTISKLGKKAGLVIGITLAVTGVALETKGIVQAVQDGLSQTSLLDIFGGGAMIVSGGALIGKYFGKGVLGGAVGAIVAGIPAYITGIYDACMNGFNWMNAALVAAGSTAVGAGIGAIVGSATGPMGTAIGALLGLAAGLITDGILALAKNQVEPTLDILTEAEREFIEASNLAAEAFRDQQKAEQETRDGISARMDHVSGLVAELKGLADETGRVQEKDEARVNFILNELKKATGEEYKLIDGVIQRYDVLCENIDQVIAAKKVDLLLDASAAGYTTALEEKDDAYETLILTEKDYLHQLGVVAKKEAEYADALKKHNAAKLSGDSELISSTAIWLGEAETAKRIELNNLEEKKEAYKDAALAHQQYSNEIINYEEAMAASLSGNYEEAVDILGRKADTFGNYSKTVDKETAKVLDALAFEAIEAEHKARITKENFEKGAKGFTKPMVNEAETGYKEAMDAFADAYADAEDVGEDVGEGLSEGMENKRPGLLKKAKSLISNIISAMRKEADSHSPSKKTIDLGEDIGVGPGIGIENETDSAVKAAENQIAAVIDAYDSQSAADSGKGFGNTFADGLYSSVREISNAGATAAKAAAKSMSTFKGVGSSFTISSWNVATPKIPKLARGAVLPANKPFMAMVGDQRHGTNIEAPLATIQEAVALVMQDYAASNLAGHEATVAVLREILEAVLGISIGDDVIANAVNRYQAKMAIVKGVHV